ncbi:hypothetical protein MRBLMA1_001207 [Sphingobium sp. LMA1-1-1.1]|uniref:hypothetical protein n=1 Tax=Sphingobium sp. LMA1-1-1.1 TaxID=3135238 RepID=UPI00341220C1
MVVDEPAMWNLIPEAKRAKVMIAAKALCRSRDADEDMDDGLGGCANCDTPAGGSCLAFGLFGHMAVDVVEALDRAAREATA